MTRAKERRAAGLCLFCDNTPVEGKTCCETHAARNRALARATYHRKKAAGGLSSEERDKQRARLERWRADPANREKLKTKYMVQRYGITRRQFDVMHQEQGGVCKICEKPPCDRWKRLHVDHDHQTGRIRGLLCHNCNTALGNFRDNVALLQKAIAYLQNKK